MSCWGYTPLIASPVVTSLAIEQMQDGTGSNLSPVTAQERAAAGYLFIQALAGVLWWVLLFAWPASRGWFFPEVAGALTVWAFALPDLLLFVGGSVLAAWALWRQRQWATLPAAGVCAVTWYACLYCWAVSIMSGEAWLGAALMSAAAGMSTVALLLAWAGPQFNRIFRAARQCTGAGHLRATLLQTAIFWLTFLGVLPLGLKVLEAHAGIPSWQPPLSAHVVAGLVFVAGGVLGLWSGATMASRGRGTPLPMNCPTLLVTQGSYRYVRNPMAIAGLTQGAAVALWLGSPLVLAYVLAGALVWHAMVRPLEEADLHRRFGETYSVYCRRVRCWLPRLGRAATSSTTETPTAPPLRRLR